jgi:hypothetical protein
MYKRKITELKEIELGKGRLQNENKRNGANRSKMAEYAPVPPHFHRLQLPIPLFLEEARLEQFYCFSSRKSPPIQPCCQT